MMQTKFTLAVFLMLLWLPATSHAITVSGDVSGTWSIADSPVMVNGNITVQSGTSLTVEPGVSVLFTGPYSLNVAGTLTAVGTDTQPIVFSRAEATEESKWHGINFSSADDASILEYCVIEFCHKESADYQQVRGGGVSIINCSPTVRFCTIRNNFAHNGNLNGAGGAVFIYNGSTSIIEYNHLYNNETDAGGAIQISKGLNYTRPIIRHNLIENNIARYGGGGIHLNQALADIHSNIIRNNTCTYQLWGGGGIALWNNYCNDGDCINVFNNIIYANSATVEGGGIYNRYTTSNIFNNTIFANTAGLEGGGIHVLNQGSSAIPVITNNIAWDNSAPTGPQIGLQITSGTSTYTSVADINYCNIEGGVPAVNPAGIGNIDAQPLFSLPTIGDFQLLPGSPDIDGGTNSLANLPPVDFGGRLRIIDGDENGTATADIGAFEFDPNGALRGDIDSSQTVNLIDTILILQMITGQDIGLTEDVTGIDVNGDGDVGIAEALFTLQYQALQP